MVNVALLPPPPGVGSGIRASQPWPSRLLSWNSGPGSHPRLIVKELRSPRPTLNEGPSNGNFRAGYPNERWTTSITCTRRTQRRQPVVDWQRLPRPKATCTQPRSSRSASPPAIGWSPGGGSARNEVSDKILRTMWNLDFRSFCIISHAIVETYLQLKMIHCFLKFRYNWASCFVFCFCLNLAIPDPGTRDWRRRR